ncbi:cation/H antiporter [Trifolium repens]|nr:cation/H antiporter [Trifolium repens]
MIHLLCSLIILIWGRAKLCFKDGRVVMHLKIQGLNLTGYLGTSQYYLQNLKIIDVNSNCIMSEILILFLHGKFKFGPVRPPRNTSASSTAVLYFDKTDFRRLQNGRTVYLKTVVKLNTLIHEKLLDECFLGNNIGLRCELEISIINEFRMRYGNDSSVDYLEKVVNIGEETVAAMRTVDDIHDLFIVGRGQGMISPSTAGLTDLE